MGSAAVVEGQGRGSVPEGDPIRALGLEEQDLAEAAGAEVRPIAER